MFSILYDYVRMWHITLCLLRQKERVGLVYEESWVECGF